MDIVNSFETEILNFLHNHLSCRFLDAVMPVITRFGDKGIFWIAVALVLLVFKKQRKNGTAMAVALITGFILGNLLLKNVVCRIRPYDFNADIRPQLLIKELSDYSFPSGHTLASFEAATVLMMGNRRLGIPALILAFLIAFSRLYLYVHYPSDVLAGALLGTVIGIASYKITDSFYKRRHLKKAEK